jgi:hypothetical protein
MTNSYIKGSPIILPFDENDKIALYSEGGYVSASFICIL